MYTGTGPTTNGLGPVGQVGPVAKCWYNLVHNHEYDYISMNIIIFGLSPLQVTTSVISTSLKELRSLH